MISETRTKVKSWLKSPRNAVIAGVISVGVISAGTMSAFALNGSFSEPETPQSNVVATESTEDPQNTPTETQKHCAY